MLRASVFYIDIAAFTARSNLCHITLHFRPDDAYANKYTGLDQAWYPSSVVMHIQIGLSAI